MSVAGHNPRLGGEHDLYPTGEWCVHRLLDRVRLPRGRWMEPCAGGGAIIRAVHSHPSMAGALPTWTAIDIREAARSQLELAVGNAGSVSIGDFLAYDRVDPELTVIPSNPPYGLAEKIVRHCLEIAPNAWVVQLLRLNFYAGEDRSEWMEKHVPDAYVLPNRPQFRDSITPVLDDAGQPVINPKTGLPKVKKSSSDSCEYAWMVWAPGAGTFERTVGHISLLGTTSLEVRKRDKAAALAWEGLAA